MNYDICAVLDRSDVVWCSEGVVNYERKSVLMSDPGPLLDVYYFAVRVSKCLYIKRLGVILYGALDLVIVERIYEGGVYAVVYKGMSQVVISTAVDVLC